MNISKNLNHVQMPASSITRSSIILMSENAAPLGYIVYRRSVDYPDFSSLAVIRIYRIIIFTASVIETGALFVRGRETGYRAK